MAKDPTFPFYAQDYLVDTIRWTRAMQGLHVSLMAESWANGGLHDDGGSPAGLGSTDVDLWLKIKHKWRLVDGVWTNDKLEEVRAERIAFREKQREKGILSAKKRNQKPTNYKPEPNNGSTTVEPIEGEDESVSEVELKNKKGEAEFSDYEQWTSDVISGNDWQFTDKLRNMNIQVNGRLPELALSYLSLLAQYPNKKPPDQNRFRLSLIGHIQEKLKDNGTGKQSAIDKGTAHTIGLMESYKQHYGGSSGGG